MFESADRPVLLWGTGSLGQSAYDGLRASIPFAGVINNLGTAGPAWNGLPVLTAAEALDGVYSRPYVIVAVASMFLDEIFPELERRGLRPFLDWCRPAQALSRLCPTIGLQPVSRLAGSAGPGSVLRVLHINWHIWGSGFLGGHVSHAEALIASLAELPATEQAYLYTAGRRTGSDELVISSVEDGLRVYEIVNNPITSSLELPDRDLDEAVVEDLVGRVIDDYQPDVVHVHHLIQFPLGALDVVRRRYGIPVVATVRDYWYVCKQATLRNHRHTLCDADNDCRSCAACLQQASGLSPELVAQGSSHGQFLERKYRYLHALEQCEALTFVSESLHDDYRKLGLSGRNAQVCRNGVPFPAVVARPTPVRPKNIAFLGLLREHKGAYFMLDSLKSWTGSPFHLHFWGLLEDPERFAQAIAQLPPGIGVTMHGAYNRRDLPRLLADVEVGIVPSLCADTAPQVVLEFLACGIPVLASRVGGIPEAVHHGVNGLLFEAGQTESFLLNLERLLNAAVWTTLSEGIVPPRSTGEYAAEIHAIYRRLSAARSPETAAVDSTEGAGFDQPANTAASMAV